MWVFTWPNTPVLCINNSKFQPESDGSRSGSSLSLRNLTGPDAAPPGTNSQVQSPTHRRVHRSISATSTNPSRRASSGGETLRKFTRIILWELSEYWSCIYRNRSSKSSYDCNWHHYRNCDNINGSHCRHNIGTIVNVTTLFWHFFLVCHLPNCIKLILIIPWLDQFPNYLWSMSGVQTSFLLKITQWFANDA